MISCVLVYLGVGVYFAHGCEYDGSKGFRSPIRAALMTVIWPVLAWALLTDGKRTG
jgi:hypothetical protein